MVRHPDIETVGVCPQASFEAHRARGFYRVSEWRENPADFHLPDYAEGVDLDAEEPKKPRRKKADDEQPEPDNEPETTDEESN